MTVNVVGMTAQTSYLGTTTLPVGVFGGDAETLTFEVTVAFAGLPLPSVRDTKIVEVL